MITKGYDFSLAKYEEEGFCGPVQGLTTKEADLYYNEFFKVLGQSKFEAGPTKEVLSAWHHKHRWAFDLATHPSIVNAMTRILFFGPCISGIKNRIIASLFLGIKILTIGQWNQR